MEGRGSLESSALADGPARPAARKGAAHNLAQMQRAGSSILSVFEGGAECAAGEDGAGQSAGAKLFN